MRIAQVQLNINRINKIQQVSEGLKSFYIKKTIKINLKGKQSSW